MYAETTWFPIALPMVIKYQIILLSKLSKIGCLYVFYIHGSVHHESNLITVQQDATYLPCDTHESVPTQQRERMIVNPVNQYQKL